MNTYTVLTFLSSLVIFSYLFDLFAKKAKVPSVLLLLFLGIGIQLFTIYFGIKTIDLNKLLPAIGTVGLILIVLEGSLELKYEASKKRLIGNAFFTSLFILLVTTFGIAYLFHYFTHAAFRLCFINAIPLSVISSAVAIPSVNNLLKHKKEFVIYEATFSDILGIMLFNFTTSNEVYDAASFGNLGMEIITICFSSVLFCILLMFLLGRLNHHVKFFLIISILIFAVALGKQFHLSTLIIVLAFGLFLNNADQINNSYFKKYLMYDRYKIDLKQLVQLSAESAFLIRTFFFVLFGFTISIPELLNYNTLKMGGMVLAVTYFIRLLYLKLIAKTELIPELFISPRGLISILLFYNIPESNKIAGVDSGMLFFIILASSIIMSFGLFITKTPKKEHHDSILSEHDRELL